MCLLPFGLYAQVEFQAGYGFKIGIDGYHDFLVFDDVQLEFFSPTLGSSYWFLAASRKFEERWSVRASLEAYEIRANIGARQEAGTESQNLIENLYHRNQINLPVDLQFQVVKGVYLNVGLVASRTLKPKFSGLFVRQELASLYWSDEDIDLILESIDVFRDYQLSYRYGLNIRPFKRIGIEYLYSHPLTNRIRSPIKYKGESRELDYRYRTTTIKLLYYFDLGKKGE